MMVVVTMMGADWHIYLKANCRWLLCQPGRESPDLFWWR
jgi:hypothetical protein